jgi:YHS domain-containing protein
MKGKKMNDKMKQFKVMFMVVSLLLVGLVIVNGCKKEEPAASGISAENTHVHDESDGHTHDAEGNHIEAVAAAIEQKTCPIMGNPINKAQFVEYKDKKVYFCCPPCKDKFNAEPGKYIAKLPQFKQEVQ